MFKNHTSWFILYKIYILELLLQYWGQKKFDNSNKFQLVCLDWFSQKWVSLNNLFSQNRLDRDIDYFDHHSFQALIRPVLFAIRLPESLTSSKVIETDSVCVSLRGFWRIYCIYHIQKRENCSKILHKSLVFTHICEMFTLRRLPVGSLTSHIPYHRTSASSCLPPPSDAVLRSGSSFCCSFRITPTSLISAEGFQCLQDIQTGRQHRAQHKHKPSHSLRAQKPQQRFASSLQVCKILLTLI